MRVREQILSALLNSPKDGMCANEISSVVGVLPLELVTELVILERVGCLRSALVDWGSNNGPQRRIYHVVRSRVRPRHLKKH
jgi:predicted transcriptional regulator